VKDAAATVGKIANAILGSLSDRDRAAFVKLTTIAL
jgi:hypothetical protein